MGKTIGQFEYDLKCYVIIGTMTLMYYILITGKYNDDKKIYYFILQHLRRLM